MIDGYMIYKGTHNFDLEYMRSVASFLVVFYSTGNAVPVNLSLSTQSF